MNFDIKNISGSTILSVPVTESAVSHEELMQSDYVQLSWSSITGETIPAGAYIEHGGEKYSLLEPYVPERLDEAEYKYTPQFQSRIMLWQKHPVPLYIYDDDGTTIKTREFDWEFTGSPADVMYMVQQAIKNETGEEWSIQLADNLPATITLSSQTSSIFALLSEIAGQCETEWWADKATNTLYLSQCKQGTEVALTVGGNVKVPSVTGSKDGYFTRFYVFGSTRNVTQGASDGTATNSTVNKRLTLDPAKYPGGYIDSKGHFGTDGVFVSDLQDGEIFTTKLIFDDIYPSSKLAISDVRARLKYRLDANGNKVQAGTDDDGNPVYEQYAIWYFQIAGFNFDPDTIIEGMTLSASFESGQLAGRDFELSYHDKAETVNDNTSDVVPFNIKAGDYEIIIDESTGTIIPGLSYIIPQNGDQIVLYNIEMPAEYTVSARSELETKANTEITRRMADNNSYEFDSNPVDFYENGTDLSLGRAVTFTNNGNTLSTRVLMVEKHLDFPCQQRIRVGNEIIKGNTQQLREEVTNANQNIDIIQAFNDLSKSLYNTYGQYQREMTAWVAAMKNMWQFDPEHPDTIYSIYNVYTTRGLSALGFSPDMGGGGGATTLGELANVGEWADEVPQADRVMVQLAGATHWSSKPLSEFVGLDEEALAAYLVENGYATQKWVNGNGYATEEWVTGKGYATQGWVNGVLAGYSPADHTHTFASLTSKPSTLAGYGITDAYTKLETDEKLSAKLDKATFEELFEKVELSDGTFAIHAKFGLYSDSFLSALGMNPDGGGGGASSLSELSDVSLSGLQDGQALTWDEAAQKWMNKTLEAGLDEEALAEYLASNNYLTATTGDNRYVKKTGDTMTGTLRVRTSANPYGALLTGDSSSGYLQLGNMADNSGTHIGYICGPGGTYIDRLSIHATNTSIEGKLGIGTTSPTYNLHVAGNGYFANTLTVKDSIIVTYASSAYGVRLTGDASTGYVQFGEIGNTQGTHNGIMCGYFNTNLTSLNVKGTTNDVLKVNNYTVLNTGNYTSTLDGRYVTLGTTQTISGAKTFSNHIFIRGSERNDIFTVFNSAGSIKTNNSGGGNLTAIVHALSFKWYNSDWQIGNIRSDSEESKGFGITKGNSNLVFRVDDTNGWLNGYPILTSNNYTSTLDTRYVKKSGDTMTGILRIAEGTTSNLKGIQASNGSQALLAHIGNDSYVAQKTGTTRIRSGATNLLHSRNGTDYTIWDSFNDGSGSGLDADTVDGVHNGSLAAAVLNSQGRSDMITGKPAKNGLQMFDVYDGTGKGYPTGYGNLLRLRGGVSSGCGELLLGWSGSNNGIEHVYYRNNRDMSDTWSAWRTLAFTTDNVESATKLQTARTLWGQPFDGTANVSGNMTGVGTITFTNGARIYDNTSQLVLRGIDNSGVTLSSVEFRRADDANSDNMTLGSSACRWANVFSVTGNFSEYVYSVNGWFQCNTSGRGLYNSSQSARWFATGGCWNSDKPIIPSTNNTQSIGTSSYRWNYGYFTNINTNGLTVSSTLAVIGNATLNGLVTCNNNIVFNQVPVVNTGARYLYFGSNYDYGRIGWEDSTNFYIQGVSAGGTMHLCARNVGKLGNVDIQSATVTLSNDLAANGAVSCLMQTTTSDMRLKDKLADIVLPVEAVAAAPAMLFAWKRNGLRDVGSSAQYWQGILPEAVKERGGWLEMEYGNLALVSAISIAKKVVSHEERIAQLEKENIGLKNKIKELERRIAP